MIALIAFLVLAIPGAILAWINSETYALWTQGLIPHNNEANHGWFPYGWTVVFCICAWTLTNMVSGGESLWATPVFFIIIPLLAFGVCMLDLKVQYDNYPWETAFHISLARWIYVVAWTSPLAIGIYLLMHS